MRIAEILISAVLGGALGFAASQFLADGGPNADGLNDMVDARVAELLEAVGLGPDADLDGRISGGVAQFLADQPESVMAALERHQANVEQQEAEARRQTIASLGEALTAQPNDPAFGASMEEADVVLVEFFDYRCGYCRRSLESVMALAAEDPKLRVVLKEFPILGPESVAAAQLSLAAYSVDPAAHQSLHMRLMSHRGPYDQATLLGVAAEAGYDPAAVQRELANGAIQAQIRNGYELAEALGIRGTPAFVIGDEVIPGAVSQARLRKVIEEVRAADKG